MRLFPIFLYANSQTGEDALGNPITELVVVGESEGIFSTWTDKEVALDKRNVTVNNRKILTRAKKSGIDQSSKVLFEGLYHTIAEVKGNDYDRWRLIIVNRYGSETI